MDVCRSTSKVTDRCQQTGQRKQNMQTLPEAFGSRWKLSTLRLCARGSCLLQRQQWLSAEIGHCKCLVKPCTYSWWGFGPTELWISGVVYLLWIDQTWSNYVEIRPRFTSEFDKLFFSFASFVPCGLEAECPNHEAYASMAFRICSLIEKYPKSTGKSERLLTRSHVSGR